VYRLSIVTNDAIITPDKTRSVVKEMRVIFLYSELRTACNSERWIVACNGTMVLLCTTMVLTY